MQDFKNFYRCEILNESIKDFIRNPKKMLAAALLMGIIDTTYVKPNMERIGKEVAQKMTQMPPQQVAQVQKRVETVQSTPAVDKLMKMALQSAAVADVKPTQVMPQNQQKAEDFLGDAYKYIKENELGGSKIDYHKVYKDHKGFDTIGIGHLVTAKEKKNKAFAKRLTEEQVIALFKKDMAAKLKSAHALFPKFDSYPSYLKVRLLDGIFRGDISGSPNAIKLINAGKWEQAAKEFLDNEEYKDAVKKGYGTGPRMKKIADAFISMSRKQPPPVRSAKNATIKPQTSPETTPFF